MSMVKQPREKKYNFVKKAFFIAVQLIILGLFVWYFYRNREVLQSLRNIAWQQIMWIVLLEVTSFLVGSFLNYSMIYRLDQKVTFLDCFLLQYSNNFLNRILPTVGGGAAFRAIYLKKKYQFPYSQFVSTVAGLYVISFSATALIGIVCLLMIYTQFQVFNWVILLAFVGILLPTLFIIVFRPQVTERSGRFFRILKNVVDGWNTMKNNGLAVALYTMLSVILLLLSALQMWIGYQALGVETSPVSMLFLSTLGIILAFLNFTPDAIGVKEGIFMFTNELVRIPDNLLVLGSLMLRAISLFSTAVVGGVCYWILIRRLAAFDRDKVKSEHLHEQV